MSRLRRVFVALVVAVALNALLWPIVYGALCAFCALAGMDESSLFSTGWAQVFRLLLRSLFLFSCFYVVWRQLGRERQMREKDETDGACPTTDSSVSSPCPPRSGSQR